MCRVAIVFGCAVWGFFVELVEGVEGEGGDEFGCCPREEFCLPPCDQFVEGAGVFDGVEGVVEVSCFAWGDLCSEASVLDDD